MIASSLSAKIAFLIHLKSSYIMNGFVVKHDDNVVKPINISSLGIGKDKDLIIIISIMMFLSMKSLLATSQVVIGKCEKIYKNLGENKALGSIRNLRNLKMNQKDDFAWESIRRRYLRHQI